MKAYLNVIVEIFCALQNRGIGLDMNVLPAWQKGFTGRGVVVSILDDGIEKDHPDLKKNYVSVYISNLSCFLCTYIK